MRKKRLSAILYGKILTFAAGQEGAVLPLVAVLLVALLGFATLSTDVPRYVDLQTQLQKAADAFALAAGAELDGRQDAETRAGNAISALMAGQNSSVFGNGAVTVTPTYYSALPASDLTESMAGATAAATPQQARYVQVVVTPVSMSAYFSAALMGAATTVSTSAVAVAGFSETVCGNTPIAICNGSGSNDMSNAASMKGKEIVGILSQNALPSGTTLPYFDWVDSLNCGNNAQCLNQVLGENIVPACNQTNSNVQLIPGVKTSSVRYFDTRFGLYQSDANNADPTQYSPDLNVRKGYKNQTCSANKPQQPNPFGWDPQENTVANSTQELPLPDDSNITNYTTAAFGSGNWTAGFNTYWSTNFSGVTKPAQPATRYALYQYEIANNLVSHAALGGEVGTPDATCGGSNAQANRRIIYAILEDCSSGTVNLQKPLGVVLLFVLQPLEGTGNTSGNTFSGALLAEYVDFAIPHTTSDPLGALHDDVQLVR